MVAFYRAMEESHQELLDRSAGRLGGADAADVRRFRGLIHRLAMKTSARNQFVGPITALRDGGINVEVCLRIDALHELTAIVTRTSAEQMGLAIGREVHAFVKAPAVFLATGPAVRCSVRNQLAGTVARVLAGPLTSEVSVLLPGGRSVIAVVTQDSVSAAGIAEGVAATAFFSESSVILATFD